MRPLFPSILATLLRCGELRDGRVEDGRGNLGHSATPRFPSPLIEPDVPISGIRLSDWLHRKAHDAHIHVGDSYADLGASVTDNVDQNLGLKYFLNSELVSNIIIDTSTAATDSIDYVASDAAGNTATSTRTVIIEPATSSSTPPSSNAATTTP